MTAARFWFSQFPAQYHCLAVFSRIQCAHPILCYSFLFNLQAFCWPGHRVRPVDLEHWSASSRQSELSSQHIALVFIPLHAFFIHCSTMAQSLCCQGSVQTSFPSLPQLPFQFSPKHLSPFYTAITLSVYFIFVCSDRDTISPESHASPGFKGSLPFINSVTSTKCCPPPCMCLAAVDAAE